MLHTTDKQRDIPKLNKVSRAMLEQLAKKHRQKPEIYLKELIEDMYKLL